MEYSDSENLRWWGSLTKGDRNQLLEDIWSKAESENMRLAVCRAKDCMNAGLSPQPKELRMIRKWHR